MVIFIILFKQKIGWAIVAEFKVLSNIGLDMWQWNVKQNFCHCRKSYTIQWKIVYRKVEDRRMFVMIQQCIYKT